MVKFSAYLNRHVFVMDPHEMAYNDPTEISHQELHCLLFCFLSKTETPICINSSVQIQGWKSPLQKLRGERVNLQTGFDFSCKLSYLSPEKTICMKYRSLFSVKNKKIFQTVVC